MSCHSEAMNWIPANVTVYRSTFEGLARCGQPKPLPLYLCLNHIWQQVPSTQRMSVFGLLPSCWQARQTMSTHRWDIPQAGWDPLDGEYPLSGFPYSQSMKWFLPRAEMQFGLFGFLLKNPPVILEKASKFSTTKNPARNQRRGNRYDRRGKMSRSSSAALKVGFWWKGIIFWTILLSDLCPDVTEWQKYP